MGAREIAAQTDALDRLAALADEHLAARIADEARALAQRTAEGRFFVACVGQFKRGKSTLLNALLGEPVLPVGVLPVTAIVTLLRWGAARRARVQFEDQGSEEIALNTLADYVAEERNPGNRKRVRTVEVWLPSPMLRGGMCLVDTPGIGSVFAENTAATQAFIPHIDAALVVLGADPPISGEELALVEAVGKQVPNLICVLNNADRLDANEVREAAIFAQRLLAERLARPIAPLLEVSAAECRAGKATRDWPELLRVLSELANGSGAQLVEAARRRGLESLGLQLKHTLEERRGALLRPIEESTRRLVALEQTVAASERAMADLGYLLTTEQQCLSHAYEERLRQFLKTIPSVRAELLRELPKPRKAALARASQWAGECIARWQEEQQPVAEQLYTNAMERFVELANSFLGRAAGARAAPLNAESGFRVPARAYFTSMLSFTGRSPLQFFWDAVRGQGTRDAQVGRYFERLLEVNAHRVASDLTERAAESRQRLEKEIRARLREVVSVSRQAMESANRLRAEGEPAVHAELARLESALSQRYDGGSEPDL